MTEAKNNGLSFGVLMRYLGSKASTAAQVFQRVHSIAPSGTFCDPFGGIGVLGAHFKERGYRVWSGDVLRNAYNFQVARVERSRRPSFRRIREALGLSTADDVLNVLRLASQSRTWFEREYAATRRYFTLENAR